ncbi:MAG TPA: hypothetical protein VF625_09535 [Longimicrobium sp.]|jgi:hypothetical protein
MSSIQEIEQAVSGVSPQDLARFRAWFLEFDSAAWGRHLEEDVTTGRLDELAEEALAEHRAGRTRQL